MMCTTKMLPLMMLTVMFLQPSYAQAVPTVTITQTFYSVNSGSSVTLACTVSSNTAVTSVSWQRTVNGQITTITSNTNNNKYSGSSTSVPSLTIFNTDSGDAGTYRCFASNSAGTGQSSNTASLTVTSNTVPTVQVQQPTYSVTTGNSITLGCTVTSNLAVITVYWQRNINNVVTTITTTNNNNKYSGSTVSQPSLTIFNAAQSDAGVYTCFATNSVGTGQSTTTSLAVTGSIPVVTVSQPNYNVVIGNTVTLECTVSANPFQTSVSWQKIQNGVTSNVNTGLVVKYSGSTVNNPSLTITNTDTTDSANYVCTATNSVGTGTSSQTSLSVTGNPPSVVVQQPSYSVLVGNTITLVCTVTSTAAATSVVWQRTTNGVTTTISLANANKYSGSSVNVPSLTIFSSAESDQGSYVCRATNQFGTGQSTATTLTVTGSIPVVQILQTTYQVNFGSSRVLECTVSSNPAHSTVQWQKLVNNQFQPINFANNKYEGSSVSIPSLTVNSADLNDEGFYICTATNSLGIGQSSQIFLDVIGNILTVTIQQSQYSVTIGQTVTLRCTVTGSPAATNVYWQKTVNNVVTTISSNTNTNKYSGSIVSTPSLTIVNADQSDEATYVCFATNGVGLGQSTQTLLDVTGSIPSVVIPQNQYQVNIGNTITLKCQVTATPQHTVVEWRRTINGVTNTISVTNTNKYSGSTVATPSLTISTSASSDEGFYTCYATNSIGTGNSQQTYLDVVGTRPTVTVLSNQYTVILGNTVTLECQVVATPQHTSVQWTRLVNGKTTNINMGTGNNKYSGSTVNGPSLTISAAANSDEGYYICTATNIAGTGSSQQTYLDVTGTVPTVQVQQSSYSVNTGSSVTLVCTVTSTLSVTNVYWQRNIGGGITQITSTTNTNKYSGSTPGTPSLTIFNADQSDVGTYTCFATNSVGTGQSSTTTMSVSSTAPTVQVQQPSYSVTTGGSVTLVCTVTSILTVNDVYWQRHIGGSITTIRYTTNTTKYFGSTTGTPSLTISNTDQNDVGTYTCFATNSVGTGQSTTTLLSITERKEDDNQIVLYAGAVGLLVMAIIIGILLYVVKKRYCFQNKVPEQEGDDRNHPTEGSQELYNYAYIDEQQITDQNPFSGPPSLPVPRNVEQNHLNQSSENNPRDEGYLNHYQPIKVSNIYEHEYKTISVEITTDNQINEYLQLPE